MASAHTPNSERLGDPEARISASDDATFASAVARALRAGAEQLVFPAEVSAAYWRRRLARERGALWSHSVVSWDNFKEAHFGASEARRPANRLMRRIFAEQFLGENARDPRLESMISPRHAAYSGRYAGALTPMLPALADLLRRSESASGVDALRRDLRRIYEAYAAFLDAHGLFEPQWRRTAFTAPSARTALIACDLAADFPEFAHILEKDVHIDLYSSPARFPSGLLLRRYPGVGTEIGDALMEVEQLLAAGVPGHEIAVTVGKLSALRERVRLEAERRGVPIVMRQGKPPAEYPGAALFRLLREAASSSFSHERVRNLVLHRGVPWRDRTALWQELEKAASRGRLWLEHAGGLLGALSRDVRGIMKAPSFREVNRRLRSFFTTYLDTTSFPGEEERAFQSALNVLSDLVTEEAAGLPPVADPYGFFVSLLTDQQYVPRQRGGGVSVYPYRVSAGIQPRYHFLINASQEATKVTSAGSAQLIPESRQEALGFDPYDVSDAMLRAYAYSGDEVRISVADRGPAGSQLPAGPLSAAGLLENAVHVEAASAADPFVGEQRHMAGEEEALPSRIYPVHRTGLDHALATLDRPFWMDRTARPGTPVPPREISATTLERYWNCPFGYLLEDIYGVEDQEIVPAPADPRAIGTLYHEVLQRIYADIRDTDEVIEPSQLGHYRERAREIVRAALDERVPALRDAAREAYLLLLDEIADFVLTHDAEAFPGYRVYGLEADYAFPAGTSAEAPVQGGLLRLTGRIDRILRSPETGAVVLADYKRKNIPGAGDIRRDLTDAAPDRPGSTDPERELHLQMPAYVYLLERNGLTVEAALYYGLERAKVGYVYHPTKRKPYLSREELDMLVDRIEARLRAMPERFAAGDFRVPNEDWGCASCRHRGVCRLRFNV